MQVRGLGPTPGYRARLGRSGRRKKRAAGGGHPNGRHHRKIWRAGWWRRRKKEIELVGSQWLTECVTCDVIASTLATHALYSKVSIHEAPAALHDMAFTEASRGARCHQIRTRRPTGRREARACARVRGRPRRACARARERLHSKLVYYTYSTHKL